MLVHRFLEDAAARTPDAIALIEPRRQISYADLNQLANRAAHVLRGVGVRRGDRVVIALENSFEMVAAYLGAMKAGAAAVPLPAGPRSDRLARAIVDCAPGAAIVDPATSREVTAEHPLSTVPAVFVLRSQADVRRGLPLPDAMGDFQRALDEAAHAPVDVRPVDVDLAAIIYTSGSTGEPRGVMLSHRNFSANAESIVQYLGLTAADRAMSILPFYYVYGLSVLHTHLAVGGSVVIDNRFTFPNVVLEAMRQHRVTGFAGVPSTFALLMHRSALETIELPDLRYVTQAGGAMPPTRVREWLERGPQVPFFVMYGATEASARLTYLEPSRLREKLGSIGRPIPNVEIQVVKGDGTIAAGGEVGELVARGANISVGYWNNESETRDKFGPLGYRTGDLGFVDADGYLFLVGRVHDMLKVGAHRVGAKEIEDVLTEFAGVHEVAVVGAPDDLMGEVPVAFVSLTNELVPDEAARDALLALCRSRLPAHKIPSRIVFRNDLPKLGAVGKIDKSRLRDEARTAAVAAAN